LEINQNQLKKLLKMIRIVKNRVLEKIALDTTNAVIKKLSKFLNKEAEINVLVADMISLEKATQNIAVSEDYLTFYIEITSRFSSGVSFIFLRESQAMKMIDLLSQQKIGTTKKIDEMGMSALKETTNLIAGVYINEFVKITNKDLNYTEPKHLTEDEVKDLRSKISSKVNDNEIIMFQSGIDIDSTNISINLFLFLEKGLFRSALEEAEVESEV